jgi:hypothetical protein
VAVVAVLAVIEPGHFGLPLAPEGDRVASAGPSEEQRAALRVARRYVRALRSGDGTLACRAAAGALRRAPEGPCAGQSFEPLAGPVPKVSVPVIGPGGVATVIVQRRSAPALGLVLRRDGGRWGVASVEGR